MHIYLEHCQNFWFKFKRRVFQYSLNALRNPKWLLMFCVARVQVFRSWGINLSKSSYNQSEGNIKSIFQKVNVDLAVEELRSDGLYVGLNLPQNILSEILDYSRSVSYLGNGNAKFNFLFSEKEKAESKYQKRFITAHHLNPALQCLAVQKIEKDPKLWSIAAKYLETNPILMETRLWWTFASEEAVDKSLALPFNFHYDLEDYRFIKFMFYLKDIDRASGPHVCVRGSHNQKKLKAQFSLIRETSEQDISNYYGRERMETICGKAGLGFVEDFYCFHRGTVPISQDRLILEVKFAMNSYGV